MPTPTLVLAPVAAPLFARSFVGPTGRDHRMLGAYIRRVT